MASSKDGPVGQVFFYCERDGHDAEVVTLSVDYDTTTHQIRQTTFVTVDIVSGAEVAITLQRFGADKDPISIPLTPEELRLLIREGDVLLERHLRPRHAADARARDRASDRDVRRGR